MKERTLAILKPDAVSRKLVGAIIQMIEENGIDIKAIKMIRMTKEQAKNFYYVHMNKTFFESLTDFMSSGPCIVMVLEGEDVINQYRKLMGDTDYKKAGLGTIRKRFATDIEKNVVHGSDSKESAEFEIKYFFSEIEITK